jgi:hypothetical protein
MSQKFSMRNWSHDRYSRHLDCCLLLWQDLAKMGVLTFFFAWCLWCFYLNNETLMWWPSICSNPKEDRTPYSMKGSLVVFFFWRLCIDCQHLWHLWIGASQAHSHKVDRPKGRKCVLGLDIALTVLDLFKYMWMFEIWIMVLTSLSISV